MDKDYLIRLTNNLYHLTLLFPKKEPLRYKMREIASEILASLFIFHFKQNSLGHNSHAVAFKIWPEEIISNLEILDGFFEVAKNQNWVAPDELLRAQEEYRRIKTEIEKNTRHPKIEGQTSVNFSEVRPLEKLNPSAKHRQKSNLDKKPVEVNPRQERILAFLKENGRAQVWQLKQIFPEVTKRTLRRDFESLFKKGIIERIGEKNETFYQLKNQENR